MISRTALLATAALAVIACDGGPAGPGATDEAAPATAPAPAPPEGPPPSIAAPPATVAPSPPPVPMPTPESAPSGLDAFDPANADYPGGPADSFSCGPGPYEVRDGVGEGDVTIELRNSAGITTPGGAGREVVVHLSCIPGANTSVDMFYVAVDDAGGGVAISAPTIRVDEIITGAEDRTLQMTGSEYGFRGGRGVAETNFDITISTDGAFVADDIRTRRFGGGDESDAAAQRAAVDALLAVPEANLDAVLGDDTGAVQAFLRIGTGEFGAELLALRQPAPGACTDATFDRFFVDDGAITPAETGITDTDPFAGDASVFVVYGSDDVRYVASPDVTLADRGDIAELPLGPAEASRRINVACAPPAA